MTPERLTYHVGLSQITKDTLPPVYHEVVADLVDVTADRDALRARLEITDDHEMPGDRIDHLEFLLESERKESRKIRAELDRIKGEMERVRSAGLQLLAAVDDYHTYEHDGDPHTEDARVMMEMDIDDLRASRNGPIEEIRAALERKADA